MSTSLQEDFNSANAIFNNYFSCSSHIYGNTNEELDDIFNSINISNKSVLAVMSSGDYYMVGNSYGKCAYYKWTAYTTKSACDAARDIYHSTVWVSELNGCYASTVMNNYETVCTGDYQFYSSSDLSSKFGINDNGKCLRKVAKEKFCDSGYTLTAGSCIKTVEPTYE